MDQVTIPNSKWPRARHTTRVSSQHSSMLCNPGFQTLSASFKIITHFKTVQCLLRYALASRIYLFARQIWSKPQRIHYNRLREYNPIEKTRKISKITKFAKPEPRAHFSKNYESHITGFLVSPRVRTYKIYQNRSSNDPSNLQILFSNP